MRINDARLKYEQRKLTQYIRERYAAEPKTLNIDGKDIRTWRAPIDKIRSKNNKVRVENTFQNYPNKSSDTLKTDSEKKYISDMAWNKKRRKEQQELQDERMKKLQQESHDNY